MKKNQITLNDFATTTWSLLTLAPKTIENYRGAFNRNVGIKIGSQLLSDITRSQILTVLAPLAPQNYFQTLMALRTIFKQAILHDLIETSPCEGIKPKRISVSPARFLTWDQVERLDFGRYTNQIRFLALHGLRWGEAVALKESDIREGKVFITRSKNGPTKSSAGIRTIPYFGYFKPFPKSRRPIALALAPHGVTIHSLRKTYAYFLKTNQVHVTTAAKFMGHSNPMMTLKIYTLVRDEEVELIGQDLRGRISLMSAS